MILLRLTFANLCLSPLGSLLTLLLVSLSSASIIVLLLASSQLAQTLSRDAKGIDLVLGAQGSPIQLILSAVYHADIPTGNIRLNDTLRWRDDPRVKTAVPLSLGDSYRGFRIVGTTAEYAPIYGATLRTGRYWDTPMEVVAGASVAEAARLQVNTQFTSAHGLGASGHKHDTQPYRVVGVLKPTGSVIDRLILTSLESVWQLHDEGDPASNHQNSTDSDEQHNASQSDQDGEEDHANHAEDNVQHITAMLLSYRSPLSALSLPREINAAGALQAAAPAMEMARVLQLVGIGLDGLKAFAVVLILIAFLSLFATLYGSLRARRHDLAMLRCLGANRWELLLMLLLEGFLLAFGGILLGVAVGHGTMEAVGYMLANTRGVGFTGRTWLSSETFLLLGLLVVTAAAAALPAIQAYRTDVARTLAAP